MRSHAFNVRQRVVIGLAVGLTFVGGRLTTRGGGGTGWVAYPPLSTAVNAGQPGPGLHPWVRLLIWLALIVVWMVIGVALLRSRTAQEPSGPVD